MPFTNKVTGSPSGNSPFFRGIEKDSFFQLGLLVLFTVLELWDLQPTLRGLDEGSGGVEWGRGVEETSGLE